MDVLIDSPTLSLLAHLAGWLALVGGLGLLGAVVSPVVLEKGLKVTFFSAYDTANPIYPEVTTRVDSRARDEKYGWLGTAPNMREWVDERVPKGLLDHEYSLKNKHYEASLAVDLDDFEDDQTGQINIRVQDMGTRTRRHPDSLLSTAIVDGESTLCYDGQFFFDTDHLEGASGTQSNDLSYNATDPNAVTQAEFEAAFNQGLEKMLGYKDDRGEPFLEEWQINAENLICMVPIALRQIALKTLTAELISNTTNIARNQARVVVNPRLADGTRFYLFYVGAPIRPFIFQQRGFNDGQELHVGFLGRESEQGFMRRKQTFGVDARYNLGYGLWQYGVLTRFV